MANESSCRACSDPLVREVWNTTTDVILCNNYKCGLFRTPVASIAIGKHTFAASKTPEVKIPEWLGGPSGTENTKFARRMQRLRHILYSEK